jgi:hypothetical protein
MTKERQLAIQMWEEIKRFIMSSPEGSVKTFKQTFCRDHELFWNCSCWFCQYIKDCNKCPIMGCYIFNRSNLNGSNLYSRVLCAVSIEERLDACDKIIRALKGEYRWKSL